MPLLGLLTSVSSPFSMLKICAFGSFFAANGQKCRPFPGKTRKQSARFAKNEIIAIAGKRIWYDRGTGRRGVYSVETIRNGSSPSCAKTEAGAFVMSVWISPASQIL